MFCTRSGCSPTRAVPLRTTVSPGGTGYRAHRAECEEFSHARDRARPEDRLRQGSGDRTLDLSRTVKSSREAALKLGYLAEGEVDKRVRLEKMAIPKETCSFGTRQSSFRIIRFEILILRKISWSHEDFL